MNLLLGGPGTGKTTALVNKIKERKPDHFALLSFTRQAAQEAKQRLSLIYPEKELDWIRTIHSLAFKVLRLNRGSMFTDNHLKAFGNEYGFEFSNKWDYEEDGTMEGLTEDDITYRQMQVMTVQQAEKEYFNNEELDIERIAYMQHKYLDYKKEKDLVDFNDILKLTINRPLPHFNWLGVDEFQDCTPLQVALIMKLAENSDQVQFAGDDDQMIYEWGGVKRQLFMDLAEKCEKDILIENYRLPSDIIDKAERVITKCTNRIEKRKSITQNYSCKSWSRVYHFTEIERFDPTKSYLILARNNFFLKDIKLQLEDLGLKWSYLKHNKGESTNIKISTIHGSKGAEADVVILFTDVTNSTYQNITSDAEHRVFYVGMTRTRSQLIIVDPTSKYSYDL